MHFRKALDFIIKIIRYIKNQLGMGLSIGISTHAQHMADIYFGGYQPYVADESSLEITGLWNL